jgi:predicted amidohydrolase YtcJ
VLEERIDILEKRMEDEIAKGKVASFTILDENPYEVVPERLKDIGVWGTVFEGRVFPVAH